MYPAVTPTCLERHELLVPYQLPSGLVDESLRPERVGVLKVPRVSVDGVYDRRHYGTL